MLEIAKSEYQNEFNRTSVVDTKVGITLPIIATYFFLVLQFNSIKGIFTNKPNMQNIATILFSVCSPLVYIATIIFAGIALIYLFRAIITQSYQTIDPKNFNEKEKNSFLGVLKKEFFGARTIYTFLLHYSFSIKIAWKFCGSLNNSHSFAGIQQKKISVEVSCQM